MSEHWDVVVVGARCAGASLGATLAKRGARVLVLDADARGTGMAMSTHYMQPPGMAALERLGVAARVRAVTPATERLRFALDDTRVQITLPHPAYCVRRSTLDPLLQDAAELAGAQLRFKHKVVGLLRDGERVTGVMLDGRDSIRADVVVGADGTQSTVAKLVRAPKYLEQTGTRAAYFAYYPSERWAQSWDSTVQHRGASMRLAFRTDGDLVAVASMAPRAQAQGWGRAYRERLHEDLLACDTMRPVVEGKAPVGNVMGSLRLDYYLRQPCGDGWALIGDAGQHRDISTGQGMTDALLDGERLADALCADDRTEALVRFWRERDVDLMPIHFDARNNGMVGYNSAFLRHVFDHFGRSPALQARIVRMLQRELPPSALIPVGSLLGWVAGAALRLRGDVLRDFWAFGALLREQEALMRRAKRALARLPAPGERNRFATAALTQVA